MSQLQAVGEKVILEIVTKQERMAADLKKSTGLLLPDKMLQGQPNHGVIYSIGVDIKNAAFHIGDLVIYSTKDIFQGFEHDGKKLVSVNYKEILGIITEGAS